MYDFVDSLQDSYNYAINNNKAHTFIPDCLKNPTSFDFVEFMRQKNELDGVSREIMRIVEKFNLESISNLNHKSIVKRAMAIGDLHLLGVECQNLIDYLARHQALCESIDKKFYFYYEVIKEQEIDVLAYVEFLEKQDLSDEMTAQKIFLQTTLLNTQLSLEQLNLAKNSLELTKDITKKGQTAFQTFQTSLFSFMSKQTLDSLKPVQEFFIQHNFVKEKSPFQKLWERVL